VVNAVDPLGGSYFVETLTNRIEQEVYAYFEKIDSLGGMVEAIEQGFPQQEIARRAQWYQQAVEKKEKIVVGVNEFMEKEGSIETLKIGPGTEQGQVRRLTAVRRKRDRGRWERSLLDLKNAATGDENLMPFLIDAVKAYATVGEICEALKEVFGEYKEPAFF
jgi:methylmalonyl-CoA mutase N-terminal domain/subunit